MKSIYIALFAGVVGCAAQFQGADATPAYLLLHSFGPGTDGLLPHASLIDVKGTLYGTTETGGVNGYGTVFALDESGIGGDRVIYSFCGQANCADGATPLAGLFEMHGTLYGTTSAGGPSGSGLVFALDPATGAEQAAYTFGGGTDGANPAANLIGLKGTLYGTTQKGGANGNGTVFSLDPETGVEQVLYSFCGQQTCADGQYPDAKLVNLNGTLYGTTQRGGGNGGGTVFSLDPATGAEQVVYSFCSQPHCTDGEYPLAGLTNVNGTLYGTTYGGGNKGRNGTVFSLDPATGAEQVVYSFCHRTNCNDGAFPYAGLLNVNGLLYGTTAYGGVPNGGTVFSLDPGTGAMSIVYSFCIQSKCSDGEYPEADLIDVKGTLYGTTKGGGQLDNGTVFAIKNP